MLYEEFIRKESIRQSEYSPCIIDDSEEIARVLFSPKHYKDGEVLATAFEQILHAQGMSVLRISYDFESSLSKTIKLMQKDDTNQYIGYTSASAYSIRTILKEGYRLFYLLDTATKDRIAHADIFAIRPNKKINLPKKALKNYIRNEISKVFNSFHTKDL